MPIIAILLYLWAFAVSQAAVQHFPPNTGPDAVTHLPGWGKTTGLHAGYVTVDDAAGRALFYAFQESQGDPAKDPLVLWLNGGPGCSSLAGGFLSELGPFYPTKAGDLQVNPFTWTKYASIIFLESPAFVGWSYSNTSSDAVVGDQRAAGDALTFLLRWFERFPQFKNRPFWLAGESYGGHYIPNLAFEVLLHNEKADAGSRIEFEGFLVGNAWTEPAIDNRGAVDFWWSHGIISDATAGKLLDNCNFSHVGPLATARPPAAQLQLSDSDSKKAERCFQGINASWELLGHINIYSVYADVCIPHPKPEADGLSSSSNAQIPLDPCIDNEVQTYFNRRDVQDALHANMSGSLPGPWLTCSQVVQYSQDDLYSSMLPRWRQLLSYEKPLKRIVVYSGDQDGIVPIIGTRRWITALDLPITDAWRPWYSKTGQVGGYTEGREGLRFASVRGAGHMVPYTAAERSMHLFARTVHGQEL